MRAFAAVATICLLFCGCAHHRLAQSRAASVETIEIAGTVIIAEEGEIVPVGKTPAYPYITSIVILAQRPAEHGKKEFRFEVFQRRRSDCARLRGKVVRVRVPKDSFEQQIERYYEDGILIEVVGEPDTTWNAGKGPVLFDRVGGPASLT